MKTALIRAALLGLIFGLIYVLVTNFMGLSIPSEYNSLLYVFLGLVAVFANPQLFKKKTAQ